MPNGGSLDRRAILSLPFLALESAVGRGDY